MSRQRIRASVLESTTQVCSHCGGTGLVRSQSSVALHVLRGIEEYLLKNTTHDITVRCTPETALYLLNHKRNTIVDYESRFGVSIVIGADNTVGAQHFAIDRGEPVENPVKIETLFNFAAVPEDDDDDVIIEMDEDEEEEIEEKAAPVEQVVVRSEGDGNRKRKRRRRRRGKSGSGDGQNTQDAAGSSTEDGDDDAEGDEDEGDDSAASATPVVAGDDEPQKRKRRRRGKRGGRRNRDENGELIADGENASGDASDEGDADEIDTTPAPEPKRIEAVADVENEAAVVAVESASGAVEDVKPVKARRSRKPKADASAAEAAVAEVTAVEAAPVEMAPAAEPEAIAEVASVAVSTEVEAEKPARANRQSNVSSSEPVVKSTRTAEQTDSDGKPKKAGWWQRRGFF
jgi:ribonuclease E